MGTSLFHPHPLQPSSFARSFRIRYPGVSATARISFSGPECSSVRFYPRARIETCFSRRQLVKWQCTSESRSKMLDKLNINVDGMDDFERELQELFDEVKTLLAMGHKNNAMVLLEANYEMVKEQVNCGSEGIEQAALLDILALGYVGAGEVSLLECVLDMGKGGQRAVARVFAN